MTYPAIKIINVFLHFEFFLSFSEISKHGQIVKTIQCPPKKLITLSRAVSGSDNLWFLFIVAVHVSGQAIRKKNLIW